MVRPPQTPDTTTEAPHSPRRRRDDRGLTTLEWLLIVAAVAGLAALAVVLVQNVVDDTAEQIAGSSARLTAAEVAADSITNDYKTAHKAVTGVGGDDAAKATDAIAKKNAAKDKSEAACNRLNITYSDVFDGETEGAKWNTGDNDDWTAGAAADDKCEIAAP